MAKGAENDAQMAQAEMLKIHKDPLAVQAVYERAPNATERLVTTPNYSGDEDALTKIISGHVNKLWTPQERLVMGDTQTALFRHARAAAQRIEDRIHLTLAYPEDFSKRHDNPYADKRVGIVAYSVNFPAQEKPTEEQPRVNAFKDNIRTLFQLYNLAKPKLFPGTEAGQLTNDPEKVLTSAKGYEKLVILDDLVDKYQPTEKQAEIATSEEAEEDLAFFDESEFANIKFPDRMPDSARHKKPDTGRPKPLGESRTMYVQKGPVDLSSLVPLAVPHILEEKNPVFDKLFLRVSHVFDEHKTGQVGLSDGLHAAMLELNELCYRTQTGKDGNLCYIITPKSLEALRIASVEWADIPNLATAYGRINMRAQDYWKLAKNARAITAQRDALAEEVRANRASSKKIPSTNLDTLSTAQDVKDTPKDDYALHLKQLLAYASRKAPKPKEIDPRLQPIYEAFDATVNSVKADAAAKAAEKSKLQIKTAREEGERAGRAAAREAAREEMSKLEARAVKAEKDINDARRTADKSRVDKEKNIETSTKNFAKLSHEKEALQREKDALQTQTEELERQKKEAVGKTEKITADYARVVKLFTELEQEVRDALEGGI